jgi:hypothetical protein
MKWWRGPTCSMLVSDAVGIRQYLTPRGKRQLSFSDGRGPTRRLIRC